MSALSISSLHVSDRVSDFMSTSDVAPFASVSPDQKEVTMYAQSSHVQSATDPEEAYMYLHARHLRRVTPELPSMTTVNTRELLSFATSLCDAVDAMAWRELPESQLSQLNDVLMRATDLVIEVCIDARVCRQLPEEVRLSKLQDNVFDRLTDLWSGREPHWLGEHCIDLEERDVFCHDENCYMPELHCNALDAAAATLAAQDPKYVVSKAMVDYGYSSVVACFDTERDAVDFMRGWTGDGDSLHLSHGGDSVGYVDLWDSQSTFTRCDGVRSCSPYDEDIPF